MKSFLCYLIILSYLGVPALAQGDGLLVANMVMAQAVSPTDHGTEAKADDSGDPKIFLQTIRLPKTGLEAKGEQRKSLRKAFFLSLLIPGAGEYYVGQKNYARVFLMTEGLIWSFALISNFQGRMWKSDYIAYAAQVAGANPNRRDEQYYQDIYEWPNSAWYNEYQWVLARDLYPDDPAAQAAYVSDKLYPPADAWEWNTLEEWGRFRGLRVKSESAYRRVTYALGVAVLNHLLSAVNATRLAKRYNNRGAKGLSWNLNLYPSSGGNPTFIIEGRF